MEKEIVHALKCGATKAKEQFFDTSAVMIDPKGHLFSLSTHQQ